MDEILGQERALEAVEFGIGIRQKGFNLFVLGPPGLGKQTMVRQLLEQKAAKQRTPIYWCYVHNFEQAHQPRALLLPCGAGAELRTDMNQLVDDLQTAIPAALESDEHRSRLQEIEEAAKERHDDTFVELDKTAKDKGLRLIRTPAGFALAPVREGEVVGPDEFEKLPDEQKKEIETAVSEVQLVLRKVIEQVPEWQKETRDQIRELNREAARFVIVRQIAKLREKFKNLKAVLNYLKEVEQDTIEHADEFRPSDQQGPKTPGLSAPPPSFRRCKVNHNCGCSGAPVVYEDRPTFQNLFGRAEHEARLSTLATDFTLIKPGSMHRANGGYLVVDALRLLQQP